MDGTSRERPLLLVGDDPESIAELASIVEAFGHRTLAVSVAQLPRALAAVAPCLVLLDASRDLELARQQLQTVHALPAHRSPPLLVLLRRDQAAGPLLSEPGVSDCSFLPLDPNELGFRIERQLRDAHRERRTELELIQTKEFLERVIESSVDAIVSADLSGRVLLFNRAAARIFGYDAQHVLHEMNVERLYPPGVARSVMREIRGPGHSGRDRLEGYQVNMLDSAGRQIPVKISAALVYQNDRPVASVGIFTDIREQLRMQEHLRQAQDEIREHERNMAIAQLAGATAHELNQPLTGVIAYAELIQRRAHDQPVLVEPAKVIVEQAERMAHIVRQIGQLTRYETKTYVGSSQILDLERSSSEKDEE